MDQNQYNNQQNQFQNGYNNNQFQIQQQPVKPSKKSFKKGIIIFFIPAICFVLAFAMGIASSLAKNSNKESSSSSSSSTVQQKSTNSPSIADNICSGDSCEEDESSNSPLSSVFNILAILFGGAGILSFLPCIIIGIILMTKKD